MPQEPQAPIGTSAPAASPNASPQTGAARGTAKAILIVEDERPLSHALEMKLKHQGYATTVVTNGKDALAALQAGHFDLVLTDLIMPSMDGFGLLTSMREHQISVPAIVLSNLGQDEDRAKTKELGAIDYFVKSNTPIADIVRRVEQALS